jgi:hypothetical protein
MCWFNFGEEKVVLASEEDSELHDVVPHLRISAILD